MECNLPARSEDKTWRCDCWCRCRRVGRHVAGTDVGVHVRVEARTQSTKAALEDCGMFTCFS